MGSAERPPKALSERSTEVRIGRVRNEVQRERRDWGISVMRRPVKMSEKSATCEERADQRVVSWQRWSGSSSVRRGGRIHLGLNDFCETKKVATSHLETLLG